MLVDKASCQYLKSRDNKNDDWTCVNEGIPIPHGFGNVGVHKNTEAAEISITLVFFKHDKCQFLRFLRFLGLYL